MTKRLNLAEGDIVGPLRRFRYIRDMPPVKRESGTARKIEVQDIYTEEVFSAFLSDIRTGHTKYPPSLRKQASAEGRRVWYKDEIKNIEGNDIVLIDDSLEIPKAKDGSRRYVFKNLTTGIEFVDTVTHVKQGYNLGLKRSKGEALLETLLSELSIEFTTEYSFKDCINPKTGHRLLFDFYLPEYNCCVEYDGEQHFKGWRKSHDAKTSLEQVQYRDSIKNQYCLNNGIKLIRIPYTDYNKLDSKYLRSLLEDNGS